MGLLTEIRDLLALPMPIEVPPEAPAGCAHPEDRRVDLSTWSDRNHWVCAVCKFDSKATA